MKAASRELKAIRTLAAATPGLELLVLFGSRGRPDAAPESDWDLAYLGTNTLDVARLRADLTLRLDTERVDLVDLDRAGGLLRYRAAQDGVTIYESREGVFQNFWLQAVRFWCDAHAVLDASYETVLGRLDQ